MQYQIIIDKNTKKITYKGMAMGNCKPQMLLLNEEVCVIKQNGYSGYVDRSVGSTYSKACYVLFKIQRIRNFTNGDIEIIANSVLEIPVKDGINNVIDWVNNTYPEQEKDPWEGYSEKQRKELQEIFKRNDELVNNIISNSKNAREE